MTNAERAFEVWHSQRAENYSVRGRQASRLACREPFIAGYEAASAAADREIAELRAECDELRRRLNGA